LKGLHHAERDGYKRNTAGEHEVGATPLTGRNVPLRTIRAPRLHFHYTRIEPVFELS
jgi:hypothetical protein